MGRARNERFLVGKAPEKDEVSYHWGGWNWLRIVSSDW
jgi:hypothetical protein